VAKVISHSWRKPRSVRCSPAKTIGSSSTNKTFRRALDAGAAAEDAGADVGGEVEATPVLRPWSVASGGLPVWKRASIAIC
jgi:hypothetical protein